MLIFNATLLRETVDDLNLFQSVANNSISEWNSLDVRILDGVDVVLWKRNYFSILNGTDW